MDLPLFPLHTVLCPGVALPLHVFEPRYRRMVQRCILGESGFGVVMIRDGRDVGAAPETLASIGTVADLREASRYADGRYDILTVGTRRFRLEAVTIADEGYLLGSVRLLDEPVGDPVRARELAVRAGGLFIRYLELLRPGENEPADASGIDLRVEIVSADDDGEPGDPDADPDVDGVSESAADGTAEEERRALVRSAAERLTMPDDPVSLSYLLGGIVQLELPSRQGILEVETAEDRLDVLTRLLQRELLFLERRLRIFEADPKLLAIRRN